MFFNSLTSVPENPTSTVFEYSQKLYCEIGSHRNEMVDIRGRLADVLGVVAAIAVYALSLFAILETLLRASIVAIKKNNYQPIDKKRSLSEYRREGLTYVKLALVSPFILLGSLVAFDTCFPYLDHYNQLYPPTHDDEEPLFVNGPPREIKKERQFEFGCHEMLAIEIEDGGRVSIADLQGESDSPSEVAQRENTDTRWVVDPDFYGDDELEDVPF